MNFPLLQHWSSSWTPTALYPLSWTFYFWLPPQHWLSWHLRPFTSSSLIPSKHAALHSLYTIPKPAHKSVADVVFGLYLAEAKKHLLDTSTYIPLDHDLANKQQPTVSHPLSADSDL